jgi:hypothetical protein
VLGIFGDHELTASLFNLRRERYLFAGSERMHVDGPEDVRQGAFSGRNTDDNDIG